MQLSFKKSERPFLAFAWTAAILLFAVSTPTTTTKRIYSVEAFSVVSRSLYPSRVDVNDQTNPKQLSILVLPTSTQSYKRRHMSKLAAAASSENVEPSIRNVVIAGGGIMGTSVAYYLVEDHFKNSQEQVSITIVDPTGAVGSCASGKAGGFLARDWRNGTPLQELQQFGFQLHQELAQTLENIDYRRLTCAAVAVDDAEIEQDEEYGARTKRVPNKPPSKKLIDLEWVDPDVVLWDEEQLGTPGVYPMGDEETIAQVHPRKLCEAMWKSIQQSNFANVQLVSAKIVRAHTEDSDRGKVVTSVQLDNGENLPSDVLIAACGPWTYEMNQWFVENEKTQTVIPQITGIKCHSILVPSATGKPNTQAVFFDSNGAIGDDGDLEVYPRPDGDSYVNGFANEECICTETPGQEAIEEDKITLLREAMDFVENVQGKEIGNEPFENPSPRDHTQQVCYWPETPHGYPIIGKIPQIQGAYVATGHSVWGILQGPSTGKGLAELIVNGKSTCVDLEPFALE